MLDEQKACCAHLRIVYEQKPVGVTTVCDSWYCSECKTEFWPSRVIKALSNQLIVADSQLAAMVDASLKLLNAMESSTCVHFPEETQLHYAIKNIVSYAKLRDERLKREALEEMKRERASLAEHWKPDEQ